MGGKKIDWIRIRNDYINGRGSYRKLADKYGVSLSTLKDKAAREEWVRQREEHQTRIRIKADRKTADRIAEREASRVARLLETTDKLQEALERAADELDRQTVRNRVRTKRVLYGGAQTPESGRITGEVVREEERVEVVEGCVDRKGLQQLSAAVKNLRDVIVSLDVSDDENGRVTKLLGELTELAGGRERE